MKNLLNTLENKINTIDELLEKRQDFFDNKSEKWQDSEKGEEYAEKTNLLEDIQTNINEAIENLENFLNTDK